LVLALVALGLALGDGAPAMARATAPKTRRAKGKAAATGLGKPAARGKAKDAAKGKPAARGKADRDARGKATPGKAHKGTQAKPPRGGKPSKSDARAGKAGRSVRRDKNDSYSKNIKDKKIARDKGGKGSICGPRFAKAKKGESIAKFARRNKTSEERIRTWNKLRKGRLKAGKRYVVWRSPREGERLVGGVQMEADDASYLRPRPQHAWGKPVTVTLLSKGAEAVQRAFPNGTRLVFADLSKEGGGCLPPHVSHRGGLDADVGLYTRGGRQRSVLFQPHPDLYDTERTWHYVKVLLGTGAVDMIFLDYDMQPPLFEAAQRAGETPETLKRLFQYPKGIGAPGVIRHLKGHANHLHIRFKCDKGGCDASEAQIAALGRVQRAAGGGLVCEMSFGTLSDARRAHAARPRTGRARAGIASTGERAFP